MAFINTILITICQFIKVVPCNLHNNTLDVGHLGSSACLCMYVCVALNISFLTAFLNSILNHF